MNQQSSIATTDTRHDIFRLLVEVFAFSKESSTWSELVLLHMKLIQQKITIIKHVCSQLFSAPIVSNNKFLFVLFALFMLCYYLLISSC